MSPLNGDFIQRHAYAASGFQPITAIHVAQFGEDFEIAHDKIEVIKKGNLTEIIIFFSFRKWGIRLLDKARYNWKYYKTYKKFIRQFFSKEGLPNLVHVHIPMKAGMIAVWIKRTWGINYIVSEHAVIYSPGPKDAFMNRSLYFRRQVRNILKSATLVTNVSAHDARLIGKLFGLPNVQVLRNTVNTEYFKYNPENPGRFRFLHISTLGFQKNPEGILHCFHELQKLRGDWEFVLIGPDREHISTLIRELGLGGRVNYKNEISYPEVAMEMEKSSALVMFSRFENFPCIIIEALCCGLPVIATVVGGIPECLDKTNSFLVEEGDQAALTLALDMMMEKYSEFDRSSISAQARALYNYDRIGRQFQDLYKQVVNEDEVD